MPSRATRTARQFVQYHQRVLETGPIAYWLLDEKQGNVAYDWVAENGAQNGAHVGVTLYQPGIGDGRTSPFYDGTNDYTNVLTATLTANFDGTEGSVMAWGRVFNAGVWTDGAFRRLVNLEGATDYAIIRKDAAANALGFLYNDTVGTRSQLVATNTLDWFNVLMTWSAAANQTIYYFNGGQQGAIDPCAGWGVPLNVRAIIGAGSLLPALPWYGYIAHVSIWDRSLSAEEALYLYEPGVSH